MAAVKPASIEDLTSNNAAPPQFHHLWEEAIAELKLSIGPQEFSVVASISNVDTLFSQLKAIDKRYKRRKVTQLLKRCDPLFSELDRFAAVVNIFVQTNPAISGLIWGSIYFLLQVAARHRDYLENVVKMFELVHRHMPRLRTYAELFTNAKQIENAVLGLYKEILSFCINAIRHLKRNPLAGPWLILVDGRVNLFAFAFPRKSYQQHFNQTLSSIRAHAHWIDVEAFVAFHQTSIKVTTRRHEEIMSSLHRASNPATPGLLGTPNEALATKRIQVIPWPENPRFFGRSHELELLAQALPSTRCRQLFIFSIIGMGGVGKSQLALRHLYTIISEMDAVFWVSADSKAKIDQGYSKVAKAIGLIDDTSPLPPLESICDMVKKWFTNTTCKWLLVFDNVESFSSLDGYWPIGARGRVIITSRNLTMSQPPATASLVLETFKPDVGAQFLLSMLPSATRSDIDALQQATEISKNCGGLALALSQGARFLSTVNISISELERLCSTTAAFVFPQSTLNSAPDDYYYSGTVSTAWEQPLSALPPMASFLAKLFVFLDSDSISETLFKSGSEMIEPLSIHVIDEAGLYRSIATLSSLLLISKTTTNGVYLMHRLVQAVIGNRMEPEEKSNMFNLALDLVDHNFPQNEPFVAHWEICNTLIPHLARLIVLHRESGVKLKVPALLKLGQLLERGAWYLQERGQYDQASKILLVIEELVKEANTAASSVESPGETRKYDDKLKEILSDVLNQRGNIEFRFCEYQQALDLFQRSLDLKRSMQVIDDNEIGYLIRNTGNANLRLRNFTKALELFNESLEMREKQIAASSKPNAYKWELAHNFGCLSVCLYHLGKLEESLESANYSTDLIKQMSAGEENVLLARCCINIGNTKWAQGFIDDAERLYLKAVDIRERKLGDHLETAQALHKYATVLLAKGKQQEAKVTIQPAIRMLRENPKSGIVLARSLFFLGLLDEANTTDECGVARKEALTIYYERTRGKEIDNAAGRENIVGLKEFNDLILD